MHGSEFAALLFVVIMFSALVLVVVMLVLRHRNQQFLHQERMAALEKGTTVPAGPAPAPWSARVYLLRGLMWSMGGAALIVFLFGLAASSHRPASGESIMWRAKTLSQSSDIPLDQARQIVEKDEANQPDRMPSSVALLGLIPLAVGLAYLVFYYSGNKEKGPGSRTEGN